MSTERWKLTRLALSLATALVCSALLIIVIGVGRFATYGAGLAFDLCVIGWLWLCAELLARVRHAAGLVSVALAALLFGLTTLIFAHTWFFDVAIERRLTLLELTWKGLSYFFEVALPRPGLAVYGAACIALALLTGGLMRSSKVLRGRALLPIGALLAVGTLLSTRAERVTSPLFDTCEELWKFATSRAITPQENAQTEQLADTLDKSPRTHATPPPRFSKVIVLVMETMTARTFEQERSALPGGTFLQRERPHFHEFERYYPNNQDSRTGMLDMLFSRLIPYEAYADEDYQHYRKLADQSSLVDRMRALGYDGAFAVSQLALEEVVGDLSWNAKLRLDAQQIVAAREGGKLCFSPDEWEQSCEDLVLLPQVVDFVASHERAFVYQEFIWGHAVVYNDESGKSNAAYYSEYVDALLQALSARGLRDDTLIVLTSDHGHRDKGRQRDPEVYRVPLLFYAPGFAPKRDARLLSHSDLGMLMFEELVPNAPKADDNPFVAIVGPTGQGHTFVVGRPGGHLLLWREFGRDLVLAQEGELGFTPEVLLGAVRRYRDKFDAARGTTAH